MTEDECVAIGGHCWEVADYLLATNPPQSVRACRHCGKRQTGREQPSYVWLDAPDPPAGALPDYRQTRKAWG